MTYEEMAVQMKELILSYQKESGRCVQEVNVGWVGYSYGGEAVPSKKAVLNYITIKTFEGLNP